MVKTASQTKAQRKKIAAMKKQLKKLQKEFGKL